MYADDTSILHEKAETFFSHTESTFFVRECFQYVKRMFPLFRAIVKFCSTNRLYTSISYSSKDIDKLNETLKRNLGTLKQWREGNKLSLNVIKTQAMAIGSWPNIKKISDKSVPTLCFTIGESHIDVVDHAKYLGVQLDKHLVWDEHTKALRSKVSRSLGFLKYAKKLLPKHTLSQMYRGICMLI